MTEPALRLVDRETGELHSCPDCRRMEDEIAGLQRDIRGWSARYYELKRDKEADARRSPLWPVALDHFKYWKKVSGRKAGWTADRFALIEPFLKSEKYEPWIRCAIDGHCFDPFVTTRKNGTANVHNGWDALFGGTAKRSPAEKFEEACRKAPVESRPNRPVPEPEASVEDEPPTLPGL